MEHIKHRLFIEIRKVNPYYQSIDDDVMNSYMFHMPESLRLSKIGFDSLRQLFDIYVFEIPDTIKTKHMLGMGKMIFPYYIYRKKLVLFSEIDATTVNLAGGIELFLENCLQD